MVLPRTLRVFAMIACGVMSMSCSSKDSEVDKGICRIDYELVGGESSARFDLLKRTSAGHLTRGVYGNGRDLTEAIHYRFDEGGQLVSEILDLGATGSSDARLDLTNALPRRVSAFQVDADTTDGDLDVVQLSIELPTPPIGPWQPARVFYQLPCSKNREIIGTMDLGWYVISISSFDEEGVRRQSDASYVTYDDMGRPTRWDIDLGGNWEINQFATVSYNALGWVEEVIWHHGEDERILSSSRFEYDDSGRLRTNAMDVNGDGEFDHRIRYGAQCASLGQ